MKTVIQKLLDKYVEEKMTAEELGKYVEMSLHMMLNEEREQMIEFADRYANSECIYRNGEFDIEISASDYFTQTYNTPKP